MLALQYHSVLIIYDIIWMIWYCIMMINSTLAWLWLMISYGICSCIWYHMSHSDIVYMISLCWHMTSYAYDIIVYISYMISYMISTSQRIPQTCQIDSPGSFMPEHPEAAVSDCKLGAKRDCSPACHFIMSLSSSFWFKLRFDQLFVTARLSQPSVSSNICDNQIFVTAI
jgi:hypothetical protein